MAGNRAPGQGRKPKPNAQKKASGSRHVKQDEPQFTSINSAEAPEWLDDMAVGMWNTVCPELCSQKILSATDLHNLEMFCIAYSNWRQSQIEIAELGVTLVDTMMGEEGNIKEKRYKNPACTVANETMKQVSSFGALLGLDPASRQRLIGAGPEKKENPFSKLLQAKK